MAQILLAPGSFGRETDCTGVNALGVDFCTGVNALGVEIFDPSGTGVEERVVSVAALDCLANSVVEIKAVGVETPLRCGIVKSDRGGVSSLLCAFGAAVETLQRCDIVKSDRGGVSSLFCAFGATEDVVSPELRTAADAIG